MRLYKVISLALNTFVPNIWDHVVTQSLYEPEIYFPMRKQISTPEEIEAAMAYCKNFSDKTCMETSLKLLNYLRFNELVVFLNKPSDAADAGTVATNVTPYVKSLPFPVWIQKELFEYDTPADDYTIAAMDPLFLKARCGMCVKPRELYAKVIEGKNIDPISLKPYTEVMDFMKKLEIAFIQEQEKLDFLLDVAVVNWNGYEGFKNVLAKAAYLIKDNSFVLYKAIPIILAKKDKISFSEGLTMLISSLTIKRDVIGLRNVILHANNFLPPEEIKSFGNISVDVANGIKLSMYPKGLM